MLKKMYAVSRLRGTSWEHTGNGSCVEHDDLVIFGDLRRYLESETKDYDTVYFEDETEAYEFFPNLTKDWIKKNENKEFFEYEENTYVERTLLYSYKYTCLDLETFPCGNTRIVLRLNTFNRGEKLVDSSIYVMTVRYDVEELALMVKD